MESCYTRWGRNDWGIPSCLSTLFCVKLSGGTMIKSSVQLHALSGSMEQVWCELLWPCPPCSDWHCLELCSAEWLFHLKKESPHSNRASFQLLELPEIVLCVLFPDICASGRNIWCSRECGTAAAWISVCLNSCGSDALSLLFTSTALLCILFWIVGSGTGFSPEVPKPSFPQAFHKRETLDNFFLIGSYYKWQWGSFMFGWKQNALLFCYIPLSPSSY